MTISNFNPSSQWQTLSVTTLVCFLTLLFSGCGERTEPVDEPAEITFDVSLAGDEAGDPDGSGSAMVTVDAEAGEVCYDIEVSGISDPSMAHIHAGAEGESGGVVVDFNMPEQGMSGCATEVDVEVINELIENPGGYYVNVHNADYPAGAVRGQLQGTQSME